MRSLLWAIEVRCLQVLSIGELQCGHTHIPLCPGQVLDMSKHGPKRIKLFSSSTQRNTTFYLLINLKVQTKVDNLTFF